MKIDLPPDNYIKRIEVNDDNLDVVFEKRKKIGLLLIALNPNYWPYLRQVIEDCKTKFLPQHHVDFFVWTDVPKDEAGLEKVLEGLPTQAQNDESVMAGNGIRLFSKEIIATAVRGLWETKGLTITEMEGIEWPAPTLMRYHLFLQKEELKNCDYLFYLDSDMRVVDKISDEILNEGLMAAEHPMYSLRKEYIPPYEPNKESTAYIQRPGKVIDVDGIKRFKPYYYAGGFQGGVTKEFLSAMKTMRDNIDKDMNKGYTAIWNDESHWNAYLSTYKKDLIVLGPEYVYPDSLIKEYYEPLWGRTLTPKIITLTKPFSLSKEGGQHLSEFLGHNTLPPIECPQCHDRFQVPNHKIKRIISCPGSEKAHQLDMEKIV